MPRVSASFGASCGLQQRGRQGRRQGQRAERRDHGRDRDGQRELAVELAGQAGHEGDRHEHGAQHQRDRDDRAATLPSSPGWWRRAAIRPFSMLRSTFSTTTMASSTTMPIASTRPNSDSVLIEKPKPSITAKVPTIGHRHRQQRDDRGAPGLQEHDHHQHHQHHRFEQGVDDGVDRLAHELGRVVHDAVVDAFREVLRQFGFILARTSVGQLQRVGAGRLEDRDRRPPTCCSAASAARRSSSPSRCAPRPSAA